ncbi:MAG TPA: HAD family hydrolase [Marinobacter sp.]|nr:HAD family hydrolase [Marinobacter sp.]
MTLAIFDLDNTLLNGDSDHAWGVFLAAQGIVDASAHSKANDQFYQDYLNGELDVFRYQRFVLEPLAQFSMDELHAMRERFMASHVQPMLQAQAAELLHQHRSQGHTLMIITATNHFITQPIADLLGIEHLIATNPEVVNGRFTGEVSGTPSFQGGKVTRLKQWLSENDETLDGAWFYSDSINDAPLLEQVANPVVVDPDSRLEAMARERNWPVMSLRD